MQELKSLILISCLVLITQCSPTSNSLVTRDSFSKIDIGALGPPQWQVIDVANAGAPDTQVVLAVIASNTAIVGGLCAIGVVPACITGAIIALLTNFALVYMTTGTSSGPAKRAVEGSSIPMINAAWAADESCSILCKLKSGATQNEWVAIGNTTVNGVFHDVLFQQSGSQMGIKAIQRFPGSSLGKRDDVDDDGGYVAAYFWEDNNQQAWSDWDSSQILGISQTIGNFMYDNAAEISCADLIDQDGPMDAGVMTLDDNNTEIGLTQEQWSQFLAYCLAGDPSVP